MAVTRLYHGGCELEGNKVLAGELFNGMFFSNSYDSADSHGDGVLCYVDIDDESIMKNDEISGLNNEVCNYIEKRFELTDDEYDKVDMLCEVIRGDIGVVDLDEEDQEIIKRRYQPELYNDWLDWSYVGWDMQKEASLIAEMLGYKAVGVRDEHGTSYIVVPGVEFTRVEYDG
mgnify:CR=1 FL=1